MGKYNRYYEDYYKKVDNVNDSPNLESNLSSNQEARYKIRGNNNMYGSNSINGNNKGRNRGNNDPISEVITIITTTTLIPTMLFSAVFICKNSFDGKVKYVYDHVKSAVSTDGFYKDTIELALNKSGVSIVNPEKSVNESDKQSAINKTGEKKDLENQEAKQANVALSAEDLKDSDKTKAEDVKGDEKKSDEKKETKADVKADKKYESFLNNLNGTKIKAKSDTGVVLACKYKILANPIAGVVEEVGENAEGYFVTISHADEIKTSYYNLPNMDLKKDQSIKAGDKIVDIKEEKEIVFKMKKNKDFISPKLYAEFIE